MLTQDIKNSVKEDSKDTVTIFEEEIVVGNYDIYFDNAFAHNPKEYRDVLHLLKTLEESNFVTLHLASFGGSCHLGFQICHAVKDCLANTLIIVEQPCYSMGAILSCCAKNLVMKPGTFLMFHNYSGGNYGKGAEFLEGVKNQDKWLHDSFKYFASPFLTDDELNKLRHDQDIYIHASDKSLTKRLKRHFK